MTDHDEAVVPLGRRLDALARARVAALTPRLEWEAPLAVALRHSEEVAGLFGGRFERVETPPRAGAELPVRPVALLPARLVRPSASAPEMPAAQAPTYAPGRDGVGSTPAPTQEPSPRDGERDVGAADGDRVAVPADVRSRLRREVGPAADLMRVHTGAHADALARAADADAVTVGADVHLRQGRWAPRREEGVALLAHEATHVAALIERGPAWRRAVGEDAEEALATARERSLLGAGPPLPGPTVPDPLAAPRQAAADPRPAPAPAASPPGQPVHRSQAATPAAAAGPLRGSTVAAAPAMRADVQRDLAPAAPAQDLEGLRRSVIDDVMQRLRSEIERGA